MRSFYWLVLIMAATFAVLLGVYVQVWIDDTYPSNIIFFGHRLTVALVLGSGLCLSALAAAYISLARDRCRADVAARVIAGSDARSSKVERIPARPPAFTSRKPTAAERTAA